MPLQAIVILNAEGSCRTVCTSAGRILRFALFFSKSVDETQQHQQIILAELFEAGEGFLDQLGVPGAVVKELLGSDLKVIADGQKLLHGRQRLAGGNVVDISPAVPEVVAHLIFGNALLKPKLRYSFTNELFIHANHLERYDNVCKMCKSRIIYVLMH